MSNRSYRFIIGLMLLVTLYFDLKYVMLGIIATVVFEAITNFRIPVLVDRMKNKQNDNLYEGCLGIEFKNRINFDAERAWRLMVGCFLTISFLIFPELLWGFSWFMAIAILGAGISGVCPMFLFLKWAGFK